MPDMDSFSDAAKIAYWTLRDHPQRNTPEAISTGPYGVEQIDAPTMADALAELAAAEPPVVIATVGGGWRLSAD